MCYAVCLLTKGVIIIFLITKAIYCTVILLNSNTKVDCWCSLLEEGDKSFCQTE